MREGSPPQLCHVSHVTFHVSCVTCHLSCVTCHMSLVTCDVSCVTYHCQMSHVMCHVSCVTCHVSYIYFFLLQNGGASWWRVCYQRGRPRLVFINSKLFRRLQELFQKLPLGGWPIYGNCWICMMTSTLLPF